MRFLLLCACVTGLIITIGCSEQKATEKSAMLEGDWKVVAMEAERFKATSYQLKDMKWRIVGNRIHAFQPGEIGTMILNLEQTQTPMGFDVTAEDGNRIGETELGICSLDADRLQICFRNPESVAKGRPTAFTTNEDCWMMTLDRIRR